MCQYGSDQGQLKNAESVIVDQRDRMIVADGSNHRVVILDQAVTRLLTIVMYVLSQNNAVGNFIT